MIAPDGRKVQAAYLDPIMLTEIAMETLRAHYQGRHMVEVAVGDRVFFRDLDEVPESLRALWKLHPELMLPDDSGFEVEDEELTRT